MSNPDTSIPRRYTPDQDTPNLQDPEVMPDPVTDQHLKTWAQQEEERLLSWSRLPQEQKVRFLERWWEEARQAASPAWARQVEQESVAGPVEPLSSLPWPPLSREQVVELREALVEFGAEMSSARRPMSDDDQQTVIWCAATGLHGILERLNIGTPQPTPPKPEVKRNCWTCGHNEGLSNYCVLMSSRFERSDVEVWIQKQAMSDRGSDHPNMPPKDSDGCPGWTPKS